MYLVTNNIYELFPNMRFCVFFLHLFTSLDVLIKIIIGNRYKLLYSDFYFFIFYPYKLTMPYKNHSLMR